MWLDRNDERIRCDQNVDRDDIERRGRIDQHVVPVREIEGLEPQVAATRVVGALAALFASVGLPATRRAFGVDVDSMDLEGLAADAMKSRSIPINPRPVTPDDLIGLYRDVMG